MFPYLLCVEFILNGYWRFDSRVRFVAQQFEVLVYEILNTVMLAIELHTRNPLRFPLQLLVSLFDVVQV